MKKKNVFLKFLVTFLFTFASVGQLLAGPCERTVYECGLRIEFKWESLSGDCCSKDSGYAHVASYDVNGALTDENYMHISEAVSIFCP